MRGFGELEAVVMDRLWDRGGTATVRDIFEQLLRDREIAYTTVMSTMDNLHRKGHLTRVRDGKALPTGRAGLFVQVALLMWTALALVALGVLGWRMVVALGRARADTHRHARNARLLGRPGLAGTVVIESLQRGVYCAAGPPSAIVVTRGALAARRAPARRRTGSRTSTPGRTPPPAAGHHPSPGPRAAAAAAAARGIR